MLSLILILLVFGLALTGLLVAGTLFLQGYFYTEVNPGVFWRAPVTAVILTIFLFFWCLLNTFTPEARPRSLPFDVLISMYGGGASGSVNLVQDPVKELWVYRKGTKEPVRFVLHKYTEGGFPKTNYIEAQSNNRWSPKIQKILIKHNDQEIFFERKNAGTREEYPFFISPEGWYMREYEEGVTGVPSIFRMGLFLVDLFINFMHLALWVLCLWLLLRFQFWHSLGLGLALWIVMTLLVVPKILDQAIPPG